MVPGMPDLAGISAAARAAMGAYAPVCVLLAGVAVLLLADRCVVRWRLWRVARRLGGRLLRGRGLPVIAFESSGTAVRLGYARGGHAPTFARHTRAEARVAGAGPFAAAVARRGLLGRLALWLPAGRDEVRTGDRVFDQAFRVRTLHPAPARAWLSSETRARALGLARLSGGTGLRIAAADGRVVVTLPGLLARVDGLAWLGRTAAWLARAAAAVVDPGAPRRRAGSRPTPDACPACGEAVDDTAVACPACRVAHHPACFEWLGGCGTYGCRRAPGARAAA